jgi:hypothetical protein
LCVSSSKLDTRRTKQKLKTNKKLTLKNILKTP